MVVTSYNLANQRHVASEDILCLYHPRKLSPALESPRRKTDKYLLIGPAWQQKAPWFFTTALV